MAPGADLALRGSVFSSGAISTPIKTHQNQHEETPQFCTICFCLFVISQDNFWSPKAASHRYYNRFNNTILCGEIKVAAAVIFSILFCLFPCILNLIFSIKQPTVLVEVELKHPKLKKIDFVSFF